ncbi:MAG: hypothetical protein J6V22_05285 [Clostridia bacterium]|nr:hypothetical protein [Clostridia bacterium]
MSNIDKLEFIGMFIMCSFSVTSDRKRTKETPLKGKRWFQNSVLLEIKNQESIEPNFSPILSPLRIPLFCCWKMKESLVKVKLS